MGGNTETLREDGRPHEINVIKEIKIIYFTREIRSKLPNRNFSRRILEISIAKEEFV